MRKIFIGDVHLSGFQDDPLDSDELPLRLGLIMKSLEFIIAKGRELGITNYIFAGDLIHDKAIIYTVAQEVFKDFLNKNSDLTFSMIAGNHDMSSTGETQKCALAVFSEFANVEHCVMYEPKVVGNITYVPYCENFLDRIKTDIEPNDILISHLGVNEAMLQSGLSRVDKITLNDLKKFKLVLLGHYHKPQMIEGNGVTVHYPGLIFHRDWNDKNEQKQFLIFDDETLEVEVIPIDGLREYREYVITDECDRASILQQVEISKNQGHVIRIRNQSTQKLTDEKPEDVLVIEQQEIDITNRGIQVTQTKEEQVKEYLKIKEIPDDEHDEYLSAISKYNLMDKIAKK